jgi:hypothetical protein
MNDHPRHSDPSIPPFHETNDDTPAIDGGLPVIKYWAEHTLSPEGPALWKVLTHHSACLSCSWGTGGQKGGFTNEAGEVVQRCMKSVDAIFKARIDSRSGTPAYKRVPVCIYRKFSSGKS